jgi:hypothetical protein
VGNPAGRNVLSPDDSLYATASDLTQPVRCQCCNISCCCRPAPLCRSPPASAYRGDWGPFDGKEKGRLSLLSRPSNNEPTKTEKLTTPLSCHKRPPDATREFPKVQPGVFPRPWPISREDCFRTCSCGKRPSPGHRGSPRGRNNAGKRAAPSRWCFGSGYRPWRRLRCRSIRPRSVR